MIDTLIQGFAVVFDPSILVMVLFAPPLTLDSLQADQVVADVAYETTSLS